MQKANHANHSITVSLLFVYILFMYLLIYLVIYLFSNCTSPPLHSLSGFLGEGDVVTQAIHDAQLLLRSHNSAVGRERDKERERDGSGKMVRFFSFTLFF